MIETPRLLLRRPTAADRAALHALLGDADTMRHLGGAKDAAASDAALARHAGYAPLGFGVAEHRDTGALVGHVGLKPGAAGTPVEGRLEIGWIVAPAWRGGGYAREAAAAWLDWAWANRAEDEVFAITARANAPSRMLMERLGMRHDPALDFRHPLHPAGDPASDGVTYRIARPA